MDTNGLRDSILPVSAVGSVKKETVTGPVITRLPIKTLMHTSTLSPSSTVYSTCSNPTTGSRFAWKRRQRAITQGLII